MCHRKGERLGVRSGRTFASTTTFVTTKYTLLNGRTTNLEEFICTLCPAITKSSDLQGVAKNPCVIDFCPILTCVHGLLLKMRGQYRGLATLKIGGDEVPQGPGPSRRGLRPKVLSVLRGPKTSRAARHFFFQVNNVISDHYNADFKH